MSNPTKASKVLFGATNLDPYVTKGQDSSLTFYDSTAGIQNISSLMGERNLLEVRIVSKSTLGADFNTIQEAIDNLPNSGGVVKIYEGTYQESLSISKPVTLIGLGEVIVEAAGADCLTLTDSDLSLKGIIFKVTAGVALAPYCLKLSSNTSHTVKIEGCTFDNTGNAAAGAIDSSKVTVRLDSSTLLGDPEIKVSQAATCALALVRAYAITLDDMVSESHISVNEADSVSLVDSALSLKGRVGAVTGDATSALHWDRIRGSVTFNNSAAEAVVFASPLSSNEYMVIFGTITDRVLPVVTNKTVNGFDITFPQAITQDVLWKIIL